MARKIEANDPRNFYEDAKARHPEADKIIKEIHTSKMALILETMGISTHIDGDDDIVIRTAAMSRVYIRVRENYYTMVAAYSLRSCHPIVRDGLLDLLNYNSMFCRFSLSKKGALMAEMNVPIISGITPAQVVDNIYSFEGGTMAAIHFSGQSDLIL